MRFHHETVTQVGKAIDILTDEEKGFRIAVCRQGAEIIGVSRRDSEGQWQGFMYRDGEVEAPAEGWANHATVMGYYIHRLKDEKSVYRGIEITGGNHGFLREKNWGEPEVDVQEDHAGMTYTVRPLDILPREYPFYLGLRLTYQIEDDDRLRVRFEFHNDEPVSSAHVSFGLHPGFAVSDPRECKLIMPNGSYVRHLAPDNFLSGEVEEFEISDHRLPYDREELPGSFILQFREVEDKWIHLIDSESGRTVDIDLGEAPYFTIWSDLNPFICIEPCWGLPDHQDQRPFEQKEGIMELAAGETLEREFGMQFSLG